MTKKEYEKISVLLHSKKEYEKQLKLINNEHSIYITTRDSDGYMSNEYLFNNDDAKALKEYFKNKVKAINEQLKELGYYD